MILYDDCLHRVCLAAVIASSVVFGQRAAVAAEQLQPGHARRHVTGKAFVLPALHVAEGNELQARKYYREIVSVQMKLATPETIENSSIKDLLVYFGYPNLGASDLHRMSSTELLADADILATRFFAPKISYVSTPPTANPIGGFGWRKLIRLRARAGSSAATNGMQFLYFLQNIFQDSPALDPFDANKVTSLFNQAIATRPPGSGPYNSGKHAAYFFAFEPLVKCDKNNVPVRCEPKLEPIKIAGQFLDDGAIAFKLRATFDSRGHPETESKADDYFVPRSCAQCHGGSQTNAKVNYLDTDHWFDRVTPAYGLTDPKFNNEDFTALGQGPYGVLYDGGTDQAAAKFKAAFDVIRRLNADIKLQNKDVGGDIPENFQLQAVAKWLALHKENVADSTRHVPPFERGFGAEPWDPANKDHRVLVYYLNRYCYRCHSSIKYSVFDRQTVASNKSQIRKRALMLTDTSNWMPQDRMFPGLAEADNGQGQETGDLKEFLDLLQQLQ